VRSCEFDACISVFRLAYVCNSALPTELYLSQRFRYPHGFNITVTPKSSCKISQPESNAGSSPTPQQPFFLFLFATHPSHFSRQNSSRHVRCGRQCASANRGVAGFWTLMMMIVIMKLLMMLFIVLLIHKVNNWNHK
jgi:hypothetical protein